MLEVINNAVRLFDEGKYRESSLAVEKGPVFAEYQSFARFLIGRNFRAVGDYDRAIPILKDLMENPDATDWTVFELLNCYCSTSDIDRLLETIKAGAARLVALSLNTSVDLSNILNFIHDHYHSRPVECVIVYGLLYNSGIFDYLSLIRLLEKDNGSIDVATVIRDYENRFLPNFYYHLAVARLHVRGRVQDARSIGLLVNAAESAVECALAAQVLLDALDPHLYSDHYSKLQLRKKSDPVISGMLDILQFARGSNPALSDSSLSAESISGYPVFVCVDVLFHLAVPGYILQSPKRREVCTRVAERLLSAAVIEKGSALSLIQYALTRQDWDVLAKIKEKISATDIASDREILHRLFDAACFSGRTSEAENLRLSYFSDPAKLNIWEYFSVLVFLAENGRSGEAFDLTRQIRGRGLVSQTLVYKEVVIIRQHGGQAEILSLMSAAAAASAEAVSDPLPNVLSEDLQLLATLKDSSGFRAIDRIDTHASTRFAVYTCTNKRYFLSALVFLNSLMSRGGISSDPETDIYLFVDDSVPEDWQGTVNRAFPDVTMMSTKHLIKSSTIFKEAYGVFSGGNRLSGSAYYRIYAALYLFKKHVYKSAAYFDADVIVRQPIGTLRHFPFNQNLIAGRREEISPEITKATKLHGIKPGEYFNSGVLLFDLTDPTTGSLLSEAIRLSEENPDLLLFHDQCALNRAFRGRSEPLDAKYNHFVRPFRNDRIEEESCIVHFLDQPKPWDNAYLGDHRRIWRDNFFELAAKIDQTLVMEMLVSANCLVPS